MSYRLICPECESELEASELSGETTCPVCSAGLDLGSVGQSQCPVCGTPFSDGDVIRICPHCKTPHHRECWEDNHGCSTYGCASTQHQETHQDGISSDMTPCPACGAMHASTDLVCLSCGKLLDSGAVLRNSSTGRSSSISAVSSNFESSLDSFKDSLWPLLRKNADSLARDVRSWLGLFWDAYRKFAQFRGKSGRPELISFVIVEVLIFLVLSETTILNFMFSLVSVIPSLALCVRRLRDVGMPFWMMFVPLVNVLLLVVPSSSDSLDMNSEGENK